MLPILTYQSEQAAIALANNSIHGLQAYVTSSQPERASRVAARLEAGAVLINQTAPNLMAPSGGIEQSGIGQEFGVFGLEAFLETKTIVSA